MIRPTILRSTDLHDSPLRLRATYSGTTKYLLDRAAPQDFPRSWDRILPRIRDSAARVALSEGSRIFGIVPACVSSAFEQTQVSTVVAELKKAALDIRAVSYTTIRSRWL